MKQGSKEAVLIACAFAAFWTVLHRTTHEYSMFVWIDRTVLISMGLALAVCVIGLALSLRLRFAAPVAIGVLVLLFFPCRRAIVHDRALSANSSCANHIHHICSPFMQWVVFEKPSMDIALPDSTEFQDFLDMVATNGHPCIRYQYCCGYKLSDLRTGYAYVGGGLKLKTVVEQQPIIAFCDAACHPPPYDRDQHIMRGAGGTPDCTNTKSLIRALQKAIARADSGEIPYSPAAVEVMREQIRRRQR